MNTNQGRDGEGGSNVSQSASVRAPSTVSESTSVRAPQSERLSQSASDCSPAPVVYGMADLTPHSQHDLEPQIFLGAAAAAHGLSRAHGADVALGQRLHAVALRAHQLPGEGGGIGMTGHQSDSSNPAALGPLGAHTTLNQGPPS